MSHESLFVIPDTGPPSLPPIWKAMMPCQSNNQQQIELMKTELNVRLVAILSTAMSAGLAAIHREERKLVNVIADAWTNFITSKDGSDEHWSYFAEDGSVKRHGVLEFRNAALAAGEKGGYSRTYISDILRDVSDDFILRASAPRPRASKKDAPADKEKFSKEQLENVTKLCLTKGLTKKDVKEILAALLA